MNKIKKIVPRCIHTAYMIWNTFGYDCRRILKYCFGYSKDIEGKKYNLIMVLHTLEKGLSMPTARMGFGVDKLKQILYLTKQIVTYQTDTYELRYAFGVILDYEKFHDQNNFPLTSDVKEIIRKIKQILPPPRT